MLILMINTLHGPGKKPKNKIKMIGITLNKVFTTIMYNKRKFIKLKKQKIWSLKYSINQMDHH